MEPVSRARDTTRQDGAFSILHCCCMPRCARYASSRGEMLRQTRQLAKPSKDPGQCRQSGDGRRLRLVSRLFSLSHMDLSHHQTNGTWYFRLYVPPPLASGQPLSQTATTAASRVSFSYRTSSQHHHHPLRSHLFLRPPSPSSERHAFRIMYRRRTTGVSQRLHPCQLAPP